MFIQTTAFPIVTQVVTTSGSMHTNIVSSKTVQGVMERKTNNWVLDKFGSGFRFEEEYDGRADEALWRHHATNSLEQTIYKEVCGRQAATG